MQREHADPLGDAVPPLVLDRQRIVQSPSFRRLQHKTQVFLSLDSDHYRTRLTHTLEVAHLARRLAAALGLNTDLAEVVALAHDLGHPPFGHAGEQALNACMKSDGGFEHNSHSLRVVERLEHPYPSFRGLNLTRAVRECLAKHSTRFDHPGPHPLQDGRPPPLEGQAAALADWLAYGLHDLQDGFYAELIDQADVEQLELWRLAEPAVGLPGRAPLRSRLRPVVERMAQLLIEDAAAQMRADAGDSAVRVRLSPEMHRRVQALESFLLERVYHHHRLIRADSKARRVLTAVFEAYTAEPGLMPRRYAERVAEQGAPRVAADYVAGMTDRFCLREYSRLFDPRMDV